MHDGQFAVTIPLPLKAACNIVTTCGIFTAKLPDNVPELLNAKPPISVAVGISTTVKFWQLEAKFALTFCNAGKSSVVNTGQS